MDAAKALRFETDFLSGVEANLEAAKGRHLRGAYWERSVDDEGDRLRALMAEHRNYDRDKLRTLPCNRRVALHGYERWILFGRRKTGVAIASVLSPLAHYASGAGEDGPPISLGELQDHIRRLIRDPRVPHIIGICSPTGFTDEARSARLESKNATVVLVEPDDAGGWKISGAGDAIDPRLLRIFDPESAKHKTERVRRLIGERTADLLTGGLSTASVARETNLPEPLVRATFEQVAGADPELRLSHIEGQFVLFRGAAPRQEKSSMSMIDRIRQLLSGEADEGEKVNVLAERRASLTQRRDRIYEAIAQLEKKEADLLAEGKAASSSVPRRRIAAQLAHLRKDIARQNTTAAMLNQQINIISTDIHNLTLIQQGRVARLPNTDELTEHAVAAEEMLETLRADADLVGGLETGIEQSLTSAEELAILRELEGHPAEQPAEPQRARGRVAESPEPEDELGEFEEPLGEPPAPESPARKRSADPETT